MSETENYFQKNGAQWVDDAYKKNATIAHGRLNAISQLIAGLKPESIIDIGCGDGRFLQGLNQVKTRIGLDYSESMLTLARANNSSGIRYEVINLNSAASLGTLSALPKVDVVTMMGVIHYLHSPSSTVKALHACMHDKSQLVMSFRNKLYNINPESKYFSSELTRKNLKRLQTENELWRLVGLQAENLFKLVSEEPALAEIIKNIELSGAMDGETDHFWNPDAFENWRQFSPLEALIMFEQSGFKTTAILPINSDITEDVSACSSFIVVACNQQ